MTFEQWLLAVGALACLAAAVAGTRWRQRRRLARRRRRRVLDELDEIGVERVEARRDPEAGDPARDLGGAEVLQTRRGIALKSTSAPGGAVPPASRGGAPPSCDCSRRGASSSASVGT